MRASRTTHDGATARASFDTVAALPTQDDVEGWIAKLYVMLSSALFARVSKHAPYRSRNTSTASG